MVLAVTGFAQAVLGDIFLYGTAGLAVLLVVCLATMLIQEKSHRPGDQRERSRQRRSHWGYE